VRAISGTGPDDVWVLRGTNTVVHWDGATWLSRQSSITHLTDIWAAARGELWVAGDRVSRWRDGRWRDAEIPAAVRNTPITAIGGGGPGDVWVLAGGYVLRATDDDPAMPTLVVATSSSWRAVALTPARSPASTGGVRVLFQDGTVASRIYHLTASNPPDTRVESLGPPGLSDLWEAPDGTLWATGPGGALLRRLPNPPAP
jgi:hypothetical protein